MTVESAMANSTILAVEFRDAAELFPRALRLLLLLRPVVALMKLGLVVGLLRWGKRVGGKVGVAVGVVVTTSVGLALLCGRNVDGGGVGRKVGCCGTGATDGGDDDTTPRDTEGAGDTVGRGNALF